MGKLFKQNFLYVFVRRTIYSGESQFKTSSIFKATVFNAANFLFYSRNFCFSSGCLLNSLQKKTRLTFCQLGKCDRTVWFLSSRQLLQYWPVFPSTEAASLILAHVSSSSLLLVLSSSSLNFNSCLISLANFSRGLSNWRLLVGRETSLLFSTQCNLRHINVNYLLLLLTLQAAFYALRRS